MSAWDSIRDFIKPRATHLTYFRVTDDHVVDGSSSSTAAVANVNYFQVTAYSAFIQYKRKLFTEYVPAVSGIIQEQSGAEDREHVRVAGPSELSKIDNSAIGQILVINRPLCPRVPFRGGQVSIVAGLVAFQVEDNLDKLIDAVSAITQVVGGVAAGATVKSAGAVAHTVQSLFTAGDKELLAGIDHTFAGDEPETGATEDYTVTLREGYWVLINEASGRDHSRLWLKEGVLVEGSDSRSAKPVEGVDYMVLRIDLTSYRDDWMDFPGVTEALRRRDEAIDLGNIEEAQRQNRVAIAAIRYSDWFTRADATRILNEINKGMAPVSATVAITNPTTGGGTAQAFPGIIPASRADLTLEEFTELI
jgi:hypothetical protein